PSRGISYLDRRQLYAHTPYPSRTTPRGSLQWLPWGMSANNAKGYPVPSQYTRGVNTPSAFPMTLTRINEQVQQLLPAYKLAALYFNPRLSDQQATQIAQALLYYSILYGVDPRFVTAVIAVESRFRPDAVGKKGEMGLGQLMPGTAKSLGITDPFNPVRNVEGCVRLLARYLLAYSYLPVEQQIALTLAAYNAGPNAVAKYGGVPPYPTTQRYIRKVIQLYKQLCGMQ
ncbi:MAG TPA: lytic transglycosylase domain-containing protein, partial [Armatimonadetes bacterium]|nr:lytic transglycosylase domain-containing protein [Armatimonadota bacterium]